MQRIELLMICNAEISFCAPAGRLRTGIESTKPTESVGRTFAASKVRQVAPNHAGAFHCINKRSHLGFCIARMLCNQYTACIAAGGVESPLR